MSGIKSERRKQNESVKCLLFSRDKVTASSPRSKQPIMVISELCLCPAACRVYQIRNAHHTLHAGFGLNKSEHDRKMCTLCVPLRRSITRIYQRSWRWCDLSRNVRMLHQAVQTTQTSLCASCQQQTVLPRSLQPAEHQDSSIWWDLCLTGHTVYSHVYYWHSIHIKCYHFP